MLKLTPTNKPLAAALTLAILLPAVRISVTGAGDAASYPPVVELALLPAANRVETRRRNAAVRAIRRGLLGWLDKTLNLPSRARELSLRPWRTIWAWQARGPPAKRATSESGPRGRPARANE